MASTRKFQAVVTADGKGRAYVPLPFDPSEVWGAKERHHVTGTIDGQRIRGALQRIGPGPALVLGAAWRRDCGVEPGRKVAVVLAPEGPQRGDLAPDIAAALAAEPAAAEFFDSLAQFYRKGYLTWIDATKRRPDVRAARIAETIELLKASQKQRPRG